MNNTEIAPPDKAKYHHSIKPEVFEYVEKMRQENEKYHAERKAKKLRSWDK